MYSDSIEMMIIMKMMIVNDDYDYDSHENDDDDSQ